MTTGAIGGYIAPVTKNIGLLTLMLLAVPCLHAAAQPADAAPEAGPADIIAVEAPVRAPAVGVPVPEDQLLTVKPGDHVDLLAVFDRGNDPAEREGTRGDDDRRPGRRRALAG